MWVCGGVVVLVCVSVGWGGFESGYYSESRELFDWLKLCVSNNQNLECIAGRILGNLAKARPYIFCLLRT